MGAGTGLSPRKYFTLIFLTPLIPFLTLTVADLAQLLYVRSSGAAN